MVMRLVRRSFLVYPSEITMIATAASNM